MARFWDVDSGCVTVGGVDVREWKLDSLMERFSMVFQDVYLSNDTVENNIRFGKPGATHDEVVEADFDGLGAMSSSSSCRKAMTPCSGRAARPSPEARSSASRSPAPS